jgi:purine-cytosine permease-like protein
LAVVLPMHDLEPFLLLLSSVFVPLYGVILGRLGAGATASAPASVNWGAALIWLSGIAVFHATANWAPQFGAALPTLALTFALAWFSRPASVAVSHA